jgi:hypothetical protein
MTQTFIYKEKFSFGYFYPAIAFIVLAILSGVFKYGIALKNLTLLLYPNSMYILAILAVVFIAYALYKYKSAKTSAKNPNPIEINEQGISFPKGADGRISIAFADVRELRHEKDDDEGQQVIIYTADDKRYKFSEDRFATKGEFAEFEKIMRRNCTKN